jgi:ferredoxin
MKQHTVILRNRDNLKISVGKDEAIIDAVENLGYLLPIGCRYGGCITCAAKLI